MIFINGNLMQTLFGEHWKIIVLGLLIAAVIFLWRKNAQKADWLENAQKRQKARFDYMNPQISKPDYTDKEEHPPTYKAQHGEWSPTGWVYDKEKESWIPPDYLTKESAEKWEWNDEKRIWVDKNKPAAKSKNENCPVKLDRSEMTYEEWKNQHYKEIYEKLTKETEEQQKQKEDPRT